MGDLTREDWDLIIEALNYSKQEKASYGAYPSEEFRKAQLVRVDGVLAKARQARKRAAES